MGAAAASEVGRYARTSFAYDVLLAQDRGVDDRGMRAASGVNVNLVFAITFAIGAGLAGLGGVIGAVELSDF